MAPRRYNRHRRDAAMAETRARIVTAVTELHAEIGPMRTTYALIAERADVAVPTVYKHLPNLTAMFDACVGHVLGRAPPLGPEIFEGLDDAAARLDALVRAQCARYRFLEPWLRWEADEAALPELAVHLRRVRDRRLLLVREAIAPSFGQRPPAALVGVIDALLEFRAWQGLTKQQGLTNDEAAAALTAAVHAVFDAQRGPAAYPAGAARRPVTRRRPS